MIMKLVSSFSNQPAAGNYARIKPKPEVGSATLTSVCHCDPKVAAIALSGECLLLLERLPRHRRGHSSTRAPAGLCYGTSESF